jgi:hypothetical protein
VQAVVDVAASAYQALSILSKTELSFKALLVAARLLRVSWATWWLSHLAAALCITVKISFFW